MILSNKNYTISPTGLLKIAEFVFLIFALCIFRGGHGVFNDSEHTNFFAAGAMVTGLVITPLLFVCYLMGKMEIQKTILEMALNFILFIFLFSIASISINFWSYHHHEKKILSQAMASFCLLSSFAYLGDFVLAVIVFMNK